MLPPSVGHLDNGLKSIQQFEHAGRLLDRSSPLALLSTIGPLD
jgi:hypothetical protein